MSGSSDIRKSADPGVFRKDNYNTWRIQAETLLQKYQLWDYVEKEKKSISDVDKKEFSIKKDKQAKSELILCLSSSLLALVKNYTTAREVWSKLTNLDGDQDEEREDSIENSDTNDEDTIINDTDSRVDDCSETINNSSSQNTSEIKKSLTTIFSEKLFLRLKINCIKKLPDEQVIVNTISDFINEIDKLSKTEIKRLTSELLRGNLIDILLLEFTIHPSQQGDCRIAKSPASNASPSTPSPGRSYTCGLCRKPGHYQKTCPLNKSDASASKSTTRRSLVYKRTPRPPKPAASTPKSPSKILETPKKLYKCGFCGHEGHNRTTCWVNKIFQLVGFVFFSCLLYLFISFLSSEDHEKN